MSKIEQGNKINAQTDPIEQGHIDLVVAVIAQAMQDDKTVEYLDTDDCKNWLDLIGLNSEDMLELIMDYIDRVDKV